MSVEGARLPTAQGAYRGVDNCAIADSRGKLSRFAHATTSPNSGTLHVRFRLAGIDAQYVLHPQCLRGVEGSYQVVVYVAVNPRSANRTGDYYVGPDDVDWFDQKAALLAFAAGTFYGFSGQVRPYEVQTASMVDNMLSGRTAEGIENFGMAWREAYQDPSWYMQAGMALGGAALEGGAAEDAVARARSPAADSPPPPTPVRLTMSVATKSAPAEAEMVNMLSVKGAAYKRGVLVRNLKGKYVLRAEGFADYGAGDFFNGPYSTLGDAQAAAQRLARSQSALRQGNALPRTWLDGFQRAGGARSEVIRIYKVEYDAPGISSVAAAQPESGTVMVRPDHLEAIRQGDPSISFEYKGGNSQLELPVNGMKKGYGVDVVQRVPGAEYRVTMDGTGF